MSGFDRIKRPEARLVTRGDTGPGGGEAAADGRSALFSATASEPAPEALCALHCSRCGERSPIGVRSALRVVLPLALVAPWRDHPVFGVCPACHTRAWLRPTRPA